MKIFSTPGATAATIAFALSLFVWSTAELHAQDPGMPPATPPQQEIVTTSVEGEVVEAELDVVSVRTEEGETLTIRIDAETLLTDEMGEALPPEARVERLGELDEGDRLVVEYRPGETPQEFIATSIQFRPAAPDGPAL